MISRKPVEILLKVPEDIVVRSAARGVEEDASNTKPASTGDGIYIFNRASATATTIGAIFSLGTSSVPIILLFIDEIITSVRPCEEVYVPLFGRVYNIVSVSSVVYVPWDPFEISTENETVSVLVERVL